MKTKKIPKKRIHKTADSTWDTHTYSGFTKTPFNIEWLKYYNPMEGKTQIMFLYKEKNTGKIIKYRVLR